MTRERLIDTFVRLGTELRTIGTTTEGEAIIARAMEDNAWFTRADILQAVDAICSDMLDGEHLRAWVEHYPMATSPRRVAVIMAGNIPLVGFFDLLCVILSGHECHLKPSSKDSVLMGHVVRLLLSIAPDIPIHMYDATAHYDMVIATGGEDANRYFREHFATTRALLRGSRHSIAILDGSESEEELHGLVADITAYSGLGCRSVSMIFIPRNAELRLPHTYAVNPKMTNNLRSIRALYALQQRDYGDYGAFITEHGDAFPTRLGMVTLCEYDNIADVERWIDAHRDTLQCITTHMDIRGGVPIGHAQRPTLMDYADGIDTMLWLSR